MGRTIFAALAAAGCLTAASFAQARIDLNRASAEQIAQLPRIDDATAQRIVANRPYRSLADLSRAGVPRDVLDAIEPLVAVGFQQVPAASAPVPVPPGTVQPITPGSTVLGERASGGRATPMTLPSGAQRIQLPPGTVQQIPFDKLPPDIQEMARQRQRAAAAKTPGVPGPAPSPPATAPALPPAAPAEVVPSPASPARPAAARASSTLLGVLFAVTFAVAVVVARAALARRARPKNDGDRPRRR